MGESIQKHIAKLRDQLNHHNYLYYVEAKPQISDQDYDALMRQLIELEEAHPELVTEDSPTSASAASPSKGLPPSNMPCP